MQNQSNTYVKQESFFLKHGSVTKVFVKKIAEPGAA